MMTSSCSKYAKIIRDEKINEIFGTTAELNPQSAIYIKIVLVNYKVKINEFIRSFLLLELIHSNGSSVTYNKLTLKQRYY